VDIFLFLLGYRFFKIGMTFATLQLEINLPELCDIESNRNVSKFIFSRLCWNSKI